MKLNMAIFTLFFTLSLASVLPAQSLVGADPVAGQKTKTITLGSGSHSPNVIWDNSSGIWGWWSDIYTGYAHLDWARIPPSPTGLSSELIDGFTFSYGTNNMAPEGETFLVQYYDDTTGWGSMYYLQAQFLFDSLPNGYGLPALPPNHGWVWTITVDLEDSGYEFPLNTPLNTYFGQALSRWSTPTMGRTGMAIAGPGYGSENAFDVYYPSGVYNGTWWFGSTNWADWPQTLYGPQAPASGTAYYAMNAPGNEATLHTLGDWASTAGVHFILKKNWWSDMKSYLVVSRTCFDPPIYIPSYDISRAIGLPAGGSPWLMTDDPIGEYSHYYLTVPPQYYNATVYFQGVVSYGMPPYPPTTMTNGVKS